MVDQQYGPAVLLLECHGRPSQPVRYQRRNACILPPDSAAYRCASTLVNTYSTLLPGQHSIVHASLEVLIRNLEKTPETTSADSLCAAQLSDMRPFCLSNCCMLQFFVGLVQGAQEGVRIHLTGTHSVGVARCARCRIQVSQKLSIPTFCRNP